MEVWHISTKVAFLNVSSIQQLDQNAIQIPSDRYLCFSKNLHQGLSQKFPKKISCATSTSSYFKPTLARQSMREELVREELASWSEPAYEPSGSESRSAELCPCFSPFVFCLLWSSGTSGLPTPACAASLCLHLAGYPCANLAYALLSVWALRWRPSEEKDGGQCPATVLQIQPFVR